MNTEPTTTTPTTTPTTRATMVPAYDELKPRQQLFVRYVAEWYESIGQPVDDVDKTFSRGVLRAIAQQHGIEWAPAWIVKDKNRFAGRRGAYRVPEVYWYSSEILTDTDSKVISVSDAVEHEGIAV
jgi:hypothetical protein